MLIRNKDYENWDIVMNPAPVDEINPDNQKKLADKFLTRVRPGHADFAGTIKYNQQDVRNSLERSSARETTSRVAAGGIAHKLLKAFGIRVVSQVVQVGSVAVPAKDRGHISEEDFLRIEESELRCKDTASAAKMKEAIDKARKDGESLGGIVEVIAYNLPVGIGSHVHWDRRLDGIIAQALMSVHTVKAVGFGISFDAGILPGSQVHDEIQLANKASDGSNYEHLTNRAGGIEGGMSNGEPIICQVALKPIPTLARSEENSLKSVNLQTKTNDVAFYERSDVCVVPAGGVVCEAMMALALANQILDKFGGDSIQETLDNYQRYLDYCKTR
jgi:chorismate synthase